MIGSTGLVRVRYSMQTVCDVLSAAWHLSVVCDCVVHTGECCTGKYLSSQTVHWGWCPNKVSLAKDWSIPYPLPASLTI